MRLSTIGLVFTLALGILAPPLTADAQPLPKVPRIGMLLPGSPSATWSASEPLIQRRPEFGQMLRDLGYVEGQNIAFVYRYAEGNLARLPDLAAELVRLPVDMIIAGGTPSALAAKQATTTLPIVFNGVGQPVERGLVASLARPGGNITGIAFNAGPAQFGKVLELLKEAVPTISRVAILLGLGALPTNDVEVQARESMARVLGLTLRPFYVGRTEEFTERVFPAITADPHAIDALFATGPIVDASRQQIADFALQHRLPLLGINLELAEAGGLLSYGPSWTEQRRRVAYYVDRILKGAKPADLPVEQPMKFELSINLKTAQALGLTLPPSILFQADEVIR